MKCESTLHPKSPIPLLTCKCFEVSCVFVRSLLSALKYHSGHILNSKCFSSSTKKLKETGEIHFSNIFYLTQHIQNSIISTCNQHNSILMRYFAWYILNLLNPVCILHHSISQFRLATFQRLNHQWSVVTVVHSAVLDIFWFYINRFNTLFCILLFSIITKISVSANEDMTWFLTAAFWMLSFFYYNYPLKFIISCMCEYTDLWEFLDLRVYTFKILIFDAKLPSKSGRFTFHPLFSHYLILASWIT